MREVVRTIFRVYLTGAIWLFALFGAAAALIVIMAPVYSAAGLDPVAEAVSTTALAILAATTVAGLVWTGLRRARPAAPDRAAPRAIAAPPVHEGAEGQGLAEYALILGLIAVVAIASLLFLGTAVSDLMSTIGATIDSVT